MTALPGSSRDRSHYGIPESMSYCPCGEQDCMYFSLGYPYCSGCDNHHRMPVATAADQPCPVDAMFEQTRTDT